MSSTAFLSWSFTRKKSTILGLRHSAESVAVGKPCCAELHLGDVHLLCFLFRTLNEPRMVGLRWLFLLPYLLQRLRLLSNLRCTLCSLELKVVEKLPLGCVFIWLSVAVVCSLKERARVRVFLDTSPRDSKCERLSSKKPTLRKRRKFHTQ